MGILQTTMLKLSLALLCVIVLFGDSVTRAQEEERSCTWTYKGSCYHLIDSPKDFFAAELDCNIRFHGNLVAINDEDENNFVKIQLLEHYGYVKDDFHVYAGGFYADQEWSWTMMHAPWNFTDWEASQPDLSYGDRGSCLIFWPSHSWQWGDIPCDRACPFVCE